jgi:hypothetical protein
MMRRAPVHSAVSSCVALLGLLLVGADIQAQSLGTFRWQLQPFCNVVTLAVTQNGGVFRLEGTDDQCGAGGDLASAIGTAFQNPDGTIGFGVNIVTTPGGAPFHVDAEITIATLGGTWRDSAGNMGAFVLTPGAATGGTPRPPSSPSVPVAIQLRPDGGLVASGTLNLGAIPATGPGTRMMWYPAKAAFRAGTVDAAEWDDARVGPHSVALGRNTTASGFASTALGFSTIASGLRSTAMGDAASASGESSTAMGGLTTASGDSSTAMGNRTLASGPFSTAMGIETTASGSGSTAMGDNTRAAGRGSVVAGTNATALGAAEGSFIFGDRSTVTTFSHITGFEPNQFLARAAGGVGFYTNASLTAGVTLAPGSSAWSSVSDVRAKSHFRDLSGEDLLSKLAAMPIREWSYNAQDASIRHVGPTAQDFFAAFGLGEDPLRISTIDADGVALRAIQALEAHTRDTSATHSAELARLLARVTQLEHLLAAALASIVEKRSQP